MPSGLWHQLQERGQPFKKAVVRTPGPSCTEHRWMLKTRPIETVDSAETAIVVMPVELYYDPQDRPPGTLHFVFDLIMESAPVLVERTTWPTPII